LTQGSIVAAIGIGGKGIIPYGGIIQAYSIRGKCLQTHSSILGATVIGSQRQVTYGCIAVRGAAIAQSVIA